MQNASKQSHFNNGCSVVLNFTRICKLKFTFAAKCIPLKCKSSKYKAPRPLPSSSQPFAAYTFWSIKNFDRKSGVKSFFRPYQVKMASVDVNTIQARRFSSRGLLSYARTPTQSIVDLLQRLTFFFLSLLHQTFWVFLFWHSMKKKRKKKFTFTSLIEMDRG